VALGGSDSSQANAPRPAHAKVLSRSSLLVCQRLRSFFQAKGEDLVVLKELIEAGKLTPVLDPNLPAERDPRGDWLCRSEVHPKGNRDHLCEAFRRSPRDQRRTGDPRLSMPPPVSVSVSVHEPVPDRTLAISLDLAPDLSCTDSIQDHYMDVDHQPTDLAVGVRIPRGAPRHRRSAGVSPLTNPRPGHLWTDLVGSGG
jgi:hypothetical protein